VLARAGVDVVVLEKHADFLRDFRGDTIHPSTLEVIHELGLLDEFLKRPHQEAHQLEAQVGDNRLTIVDFSHLPTVCKFIALMPQWDFLDFLARHGRAYPTFKLRMQTEVTELIQEGGRVVGVMAKTSQGPLEVRAGLVVGADGRGSTVRRLAGLEVIDLGAPMDVLWMGLPKGPHDPGRTLGRIEAGRMLVLIDRGNYWQCAFVIAKGGFEAIQRRGLSAFRETWLSSRPSCATGSTSRPIGATSSCSACGWIGCASGTGPVSCASATLLTRCLPSAASGSTWPFRTPSLRPMSWRIRWRGGPTPIRTYLRSNGGENGQPV